MLSLSRFQVVLLSLCAAISITDTILTKLVVKPPLQVINANPDTPDRPPSVDAPIESAATDMAIQAAALVDLNTAGVSELDSLPGVGPATAKKIIDFRTSHGPFNSATQLSQVNGIGPKKLAKILPHVHVSEGVANQVR